jgi:hypothetical protein
MKWIATVLVYFQATNVIAANFEMIEGRLFRKDGMMTRLITLQNNTNQKATVAVECRFFRDSELLGTGVAVFYDLSPGERAEGEATSPDQFSANKTECHVDVVEDDD